MNRMLAIVEREMRKFFRSPALMMVSMIFPLVQLIVLGNAFGGKIRDARLGLVDQDGGTQALRIREAFDSVRANMRTFEPIYYSDPKKAMEDVRNGKIEGAVIIPPQYSRKVYEHDQPQIALVVDNSDNFMSAALEDEMTQITNALNNPVVEPRILQQTVLQIVEMYPYIEYMKFLLPGSITLAIFMSVMIGGGMLYIDDKARGVHEGYLVTPITKTELVLGLNASSAVKAVMVGVVITVVGSLLAGVGTLFSFSTALGLFIMIALTAVALNAMMFLLVVRVDDPLVPRAIFGILNTLLFFPSGAVYPIQAFPWWLRGIAKVDPFTFAVHGFKTLLLKEAGLSAIVPDMIYLSLFAVVALEHSHAALQANTVAVILSAALHFACETQCGVEGPLPFHHSVPLGVSCRVRIPEEKYRTPAPVAQKGSFDFVTASRSEAIPPLRMTRELLPASANLLCLEFYDSARCHTIRSGTGATAQD